VVVVVVVVQMQPEGVQPDLVDLVGEVPEVWVEAPQQQEQQTQVGEVVAVVFKTEVFVEVVVLVVQESSSSNTRTPTRSPTPAAGSPSAHHLPAASRLRPSPLALATFSLTKNTI
jgi:hypothetical protein